MQKQYSQVVKIDQFIPGDFLLNGIVHLFLTLISCEVELFLKHKKPINMYDKQVVIMNSKNNNTNNEELDRGPFFHGTKAELRVGDMLNPLNQSNYQNRISNYIYFTATLEAAKWGAELAASDLKERIYIVEPTGDFENDPNLTDKRFPGNPTRSYRSKFPLKIVAELCTWDRHTDEQISQMLLALEKLREEGLDHIID